jgi:hypothetical protein
MAKLSTHTLVEKFDLLNPNRTEATAYVRYAGFHSKDFAFACRKNIISRNT